MSGSRSELDEGARAFLEVSKRLKTIGGTGKGSLRNEMMKAVKQAAKPLPKAVQDEARRRLPQRGGLAARVAKRRPTIETRTGVQTAGVRIRDRKTDPRMSVQGRIYHPVFGRPGSDAVQIVPSIKGYFEDAITDEAPKVRGEITDVLADFAQRALGGQ